MSKILKALLMLFFLTQCTLMSYAEEAEEAGEEGDEGGEEEMGEGEEGEDEEGMADEDLENPETILAEYDKNKDGKLSLEEITADSSADGDEADPEEKSTLEAIAKGFKKADEDGDGHLTVDEIPKLLQVLQEEEEL